TSRKVREWLELEISDDGRGIDAGRIRKKLVESGHPDAGNPDDAAVIQHIFDAGITTRDEETLYSGRGIGLDAVRIALMKLGGRIRVSTVKGQGSTFAIRVPIKWRAARPAKRKAA